MNQNTIWFFLPFNQASVPQCQGSSVNYEQRFYEVFFFF